MKASAGRHGDLGMIAALAVLYFLTARLGLAFASVHPNATAIWPPSGIALAALLMFGRRLWPGVVLGAFAVNLTVNIPGAPSIAAAVAADAGIALGNTLEALVAVVLLERLGSVKQIFDSPRGVFSFVGLAALAPAMISATFGLASLGLTGFAPWAKAGSIWLTWWLGDVVGILIVTPLLLAWRRGLTRPPRRWLEAATLLALAAVTGQIVFVGWWPGPHKNLPLGFLVIPFVIWAAVRFKLQGASFIILVFTALATKGTIAGDGPFALNSLDSAMLLLQAFIATIAVTTLTLAALVEQSARNEESLRKAHDTLETRIAARTAELARSNADLQEFAYVASHDLQEPLRKIMAFGDRLERLAIGTLDSDAKDCLQRILKAAERMSRLIDDLLQLARVTTKTNPMSAVDTTAVIKEVLTDIEARIDRSKGTVSVGAIPAVQADPLQVRLLFQNLLSNALKFHDKETTPRVSVQGRRIDNGLVRIEVWDNGIGIDPKHSQQIFKPFQRLHPRGEYEGTGIGLAICDKIVARHGGTISVDSTPGKGSTFIVTLPFAKGARPEGR